MQTPAADRTAKRLSAREWLTRYGAFKLLNRGGQQAQPQASIPADRIAVRA